jgi:glycosyltransferase involved in cell wall biosynthesis
MNSEEKISVVINTYNAEEHLQRVIESVKDFDEVLVCDMESTDHTVEIAQNMGCRVITFPRGNYSIAEPARDFAIHQATYNWVLVIDADELVTKELQQYLYEATTHPDKPAGISIPRKNYFMGRFLHGYYPDYVLRFFQRDLAYWPPTIHSLPTVNGKVEYIPKKLTKLALVHLANDSVSDIVRKSNTYSDNELPRRRPKNYGLWALLHRPFFRFFKFYVLKGGFRDGMPGFIRALLDAVYQVIIIVKLIEERYNNSVK